VPDVGGCSEDLRRAGWYICGRIEKAAPDRRQRLCGTGLDAIPLPGDSTTDQIARLLLDVAALAMRLRKPLSARLFPVPGTRTGKPTTFSSPYLTNTCVKW